MIVNEIAKLPKPLHGPIELLGVAELMQQLFVRTQLVPLAGLAGRIGTHAPSRARDPAGGG